MKGISSLNNKPTSSWAKIMALFLINFAIGYVLVQKTLFPPENRQVIITKLQQWQSQLCTQGIRLPSIPCNQSILKKNTEQSTEPLTTQFARLPDLTAALEKLHWQHGTEVDALKLITVIKSIETSRRHQSRENYDALPIMHQKLSPVWQRYPLLVAAAACVYCGNHSRVLSTLISTELVIDNRVQALAQGHPLLLKEVATLGTINPKEQRRIATIHAELFAPGDAPTSKFIASQLIKKGDDERLRVWVSKGLNGSRAFAQTEYGNIPFDIVAAAWRQGIRLGYDEAALTRFMVSKGYRPALRWLIWLEGSQLSYLKKRWEYKRQAKEYQQILRDYTNFAIADPRALSTFYSQHWRKIFWDKEQQRWLF